MMPSFLLNSEEIWWRQLSHLCAITRQWCLAQFAGHGSNDLAVNEARLRASPTGSIPSRSNTR